MRLVLLLTTLFLNPVQTQLINMAVCSDKACQSNCVYWSTSANACAPCTSNKGPCSVSNPSSITKSDSLTLYSDLNCAGENALTNPMPIVLDNSCRQLVTSGINVGSYRAQNVSAIIGATVAAVAVLTVFCIIGWCCYCKRRAAQRDQQQQQQPPIDTYVLPSASVQQTYPTAYPTYNQNTTYVPTPKYGPPYSASVYTSYPTAQYVPQTTYQPSSYGSYPPPAQYDYYPQPSAPPPPYAALQQQQLQQPQLQQQQLQQPQLQQSQPQKYI